MKIVIIFLTLISLSHAWDNVDFEIFDLYEEVNGTFYEFLGVPQDASVTEIRRAYRKRSKELHPDKNKAENAEVMFRQLVAVYEILKDSEKREKYEAVLRDGLPTWRQPIYYYRKYRKMGTLEISILISVIATIGHYLTWWVAYLEKRFIMEERLAPEQKKRDKKRAKGEIVEELNVEEFLEQELGYRKPGRWDILPFVLFRLLKRAILSVPGYIRALREERKEKEEQRKREEEEAREAAEKAAIPKPKKVRAPKVIRDASEFEDEEGWVIPGMPTPDKGDEGEEKKKEIKKSEWTEEDFAALAKAMAKYPGGTPGRWQRIAQDLGRSSSDITKKVKGMKENFAVNLPSHTGQTNSTEPVVTKKLDINLSDTMITKAIGSELDKTSINTGFYQSQYDIPDDYDQGFANDEEDEEIDYTAPKKKQKVKTRPMEEKKEEENDSTQTEEQNKSENNTTENTTNTDVEEKVEKDFWTQIQQKCLENAIQQFPKSVSDRWTCIARAVPGKTKEQCIARYKTIAEQILKRKAKQSKGS